MEGMVEKYWNGRKNVENDTVGIIGVSELYFFSLKEYIFSG